MYNGPGNQGAPLQANCNPNYSAYGADSFLFTSQYWVPSNNEILIIQLVFNVANTSSTYYSAGSTLSSGPAPIVTVTVYNKVISREILASIGTGNTCPKPKIYSSGVISLKYLQTGQVFSPGVASQFLFNNVPVVIADGFIKQYATFGIVYVPPYVDSTYSNLSSYLTAHNVGANSTGNGYVITGNLPVADITNGSSTNGTPNYPVLPATSPTGIAGIQGTSTSYGHFVVTVAYSVNASYYNPGTTFNCEVLVKNIWRSPIAIFNSYSAFSVNDLANKQVVLLFGKSTNGGTFLVTNTGTPLAQITNYGVTSLGNFMLIMKTLVSTFDNSYNLCDYFINTTLITNINNLSGINIQPILLQPY